jgi:hypothetical protein
LTYQLLETAVLVRDVPEHGLKAGDLGVVVHVYAGGVLEVEFARGDGKTPAVVTLEAGDLRPPGRRA